MISMLRSFNELTFPIVAVPKELHVSEEKDVLRFGKYMVHKKDNLLTSLSIKNQVELLPSSHFYETPEALLSNLKTVKKHYLLTNNFDVFNCVKKVEVHLKTSKILKDYGEYFTVKKISYYFTKRVPQPSEKHDPLFAVVNSLIFNIGWSTNFKPITVKL